MNVYTVIAGILSVATFVDPATGMQYMSWGRTRMAAMNRLNRFLDNEPEIQ